jgi:hypothetical protein
MNNFNIPVHLRKPEKIQEFLDNTHYNASKSTRSPLLVYQRKEAHCFEGAMFAAACLEQAGYQPLVLDMIAEDDDDHVIAVYKINHSWGAIAKSNFTTLRYREPVYKTLRELVMSYFDFYFNTIGFKSLRAYSRPVNLNRFNYLNWRSTHQDLETIGDYLNSVVHYPLLTEDQLSLLAPATSSLLSSSLQGANPEGLFVPGSKKIFRSPRPGTRP